MNLKIILIGMFVIIFSAIAFASVDQVNLITPSNGQWDADGNIIFNCTAKPSSDTNITNITLKIWWPDGTLYYNITNTTPGNTGEEISRIFTVSNIPENKTAYYS